ncbi:MAG: ABC transporter ATP-binding protein [Bacillota bacterium]
MMFGGPGRHRGPFVPGEPVRLERKTLSYAWRLAGYLKPYSGKLALSACFMVGSSLAGVAGPFILGMAIDRFIRAGDTRGLGFAGMLYLGVSLANWAFSYLQTYITSQVGHGLIAELRQQLFEHVERLRMSYIDREETGRLMSRITSDIDSISQLLSTGLASLLSDLLMLTGIVVILFAMNLRLALISALTIPALVSVTYLFQGNMQRAFTKVRRSVAEVNANLEESLSGIRVIQSFGREDVNMHRFSEVNASTMEANLEAARTFALFFPIVDVIGALGTAAILFAGGRMIIQGELQVGALAAFLSYVTRFFMPIREISQIYNMVVAALASAQRIFELMDEPVEPLGGLKLKRVRGQVKFEDVVFWYDRGTPVLEGVTLEALPGQMTAIVGPTGAGKTSIINLLTGMYQPVSGCISIDGVDISKVDLASLRRNVGVVLQDNFVFAGTILDNIRYGKPDATLDQVEVAAKAAGAHDFIVKLKDGYYTLIGERGSGISVGQKQLIALARALLVDPPILVLDEATSNVDPYTEFLIQQALSRLMRDRTLIVIAHRLSTVRQAARIYVIQEGKVVEMGTHDQLIAKDGVYRALYQSQAL